MCSRPRPPTCSVSDGSGLLIPPVTTVLQGISLAVTLEIAARGAWTSPNPRLNVADVEAADEVMLVSTPYCLLPVTRINDSAIAGGVPGANYWRLLSGWNDIAGFDVADQARSISIEAR